MTKKRATTPTMAPTSSFIFTSLMLTGNGGHWLL